MKRSIFSNASVSETGGNSGERSFNIQFHFIQKHLKKPRLFIYCGILLLFCNNILETETLGIIGGSFSDDLYSDSHYILSRTKRSDALSTIKDATRIVPANYSIHEPPPTKNGSATNVGFYVLIVDVRDVNEVKEELSLELNLQIYWKDTRLSHLTDQTSEKSFVVLNPVLLGHLWHPDVYIDHVIKVEQPNFISPPISLRIYPDSTIRYSARLTIVMACQMDFHYYPADSQRCNIDMKSYAYMNKILSLDWREGKEAAIKKNLILPNFEVALGNTQNFSVFTSSGVYSSIRFTVILRRYISFHLIQTYLPSALFVIVSFLSFLVAPESIPGRMTLCMTTLLTLTAMFSSVKQNTPNVSYVKGLDVWMVTCIFFVFFVLLEYSILLKLKYLKPRERKRKQKKKYYPQGKVENSQICAGNSGPGAGIFIPFGDSPTSHFGTNNASTNGLVNRNGNGSTLTIPEVSSTSLPSQPLQKCDSLIKRKTKHEDLSLRVEHWFSRIIPALFLIFNLAYWPWLLLTADYYNETEFRATNYAM